MELSMLNPYRMICKPLDMKKLVIDDEAAIDDEIRFPWENANDWQIYAKN